ncbi:hypothetical protein QBC40DRAFT_260602 [Triangularia verruculosa]|uniref:Uncharacterized protein n=1 Tax=Triangularia verruculosa TaxID=2587418 RepID=A0AAN6XU16_9PEZI|nr:hypothetical protein QBC40DRAFT_260602 [Triangularia verruculosa]
MPVLDLADGNYRSEALLRASQDDTREDLYLELHIYRHDHGATFGRLGINHGCKAGGTDSSTCFIYLLRVKGFTEVPELIRLIAVSSTLMICRINETVYAFFYKAKLPVHLEMINLGPGWTLAHERSAIVEAEITDKNIWLFLFDTHGSFLSRYRWNIVLNPDPIIEKAVRSCFDERLTEGTNGIFFERSHPEQLYCITYSTYFHGSPGNGYLRVRELREGGPDTIFNQMRIVTSRCAQHRGEAPLCPTWSALIPDFDYSKHLLAWSDKEDQDSAAMHVRSNLVLCTSARKVKRYFPLAVEFVGFDNLRKPPIMDPPDLICWDLERKRFAALKTEHI